MCASDDRLIADDVVDPCWCTYVADLNDRPVLLPESYETCPQHGRLIDGSVAESPHTTSAHKDDV